MPGRAVVRRSDRRASILRDAAMNEAATAHGRGPGL
jgi:hypothetical protein